MPLYAAIRFSKVRKKLYVIPTAMTSKGATVTVTNTKNGTVDTGVLLNNAPYIAIIGGAAVVAIYAVNKRRHSDMD